MERANGEWEFLYEKLKAEKEAAEEMWRRWEASARKTGEALVATTLERDGLRQTILEAFCQACRYSDARYPETKYSHDCLSTWEGIQADLIEWGMIKKEECRYQ